MILTFVRRCKLAPDIWEHHFTPERKLAYQPGQYIDVTLRNHSADPRGMTRTFTLTSLPADEPVSFVDKYLEPASLYKQALHNIKPGDTVFASDAMGDMVLPMDNTVPLVFVAGGIAIASYVGMLKSLAGTSQKSDINLLYGLRSADQIIYRNVWETVLGDASRVYVSPRRIAADDIMQVARPDSLIYLSGSQRFVDDLLGQLLARGISRSMIVFDYYDGYTEEQI